MADNYSSSIQIVAMEDCSGENEEKYEIYDTGSDVLCVIGVENKQSSKIPGTKPRYKQSYREAWESMRDFKGWLTSVPGNSSKAYCKLCKKELHCHRLSLLKHKVTYKHHKKEEEQKLMKICGVEKSRTNIKKIKRINIEDAEENKFTDDDSPAFVKDNKSNTVDENTSIFSSQSSKETNVPFHNKEEELNLNKGYLSTHVLDISKGMPAASVHIVLYKLIEGRWTLICEGMTGSDGRYNYFVTNKSEFSVGRYKLHFDIDKYFEKQNQETMFPFVEIAFDVKDNLSHHHIPLLLSPYGFTTYKGS